MVIKPNSYLKNDANTILKYNTFEACKYIGIGFKETYITYLIYMHYTYMEQPEHVLLYIETTLSNIHQTFTLHLFFFSVSEKVLSCLSRIII